MTDMRFDTYYRFADLERILREYAREHPGLVRMESIGKSYEGRDLWVLAVTNRETGCAEDKPALWVDGNIHANEVSGSSACLYLLHTLVAQYGRDPDITRCLDTRAFYVCPRVGPDGAELYLADRPRFLRSSTRPYPSTEDTPGGLIREDVDGDGRILTMRIPDPNGAWKVCPEEPRLIVARDPAETGGTYFRLLWEGRIEDYDGWLLRLRKDREQLDLNRNFPLDWRQEHEQAGGGPFPTSEPEVRAVASFIAGHRNITGGVTFHTWGGALLRPYSHRGDDAFPGKDLALYRKLGEKGKEFTGYMHGSSREIWGDGSRGGMQTSWLYDHMGVFAWTVELWNPYKLAGIENFLYARWFDDHPLDDERKLLKWSDEALGGRGYADWYSFEHPQLGRVELGGWDWEHFISNPPPEFLERTVAPFPRWLVWHLLISPRLEILHAAAEPLGDELHRVRLVIANAGWLPTNVTEMALRKNLASPAVCEIELPPGASLENGQPRVAVGQLGGRAHKTRYLGTSMGLDPTSDRAKVEWIVRAPTGTAVRLSAAHPRAGRVATEVRL
jgi:hypothetical protein